MGRSMNLSGLQLLLGAAIVNVICLVALSRSALAQTGDNAVYNNLGAIISSTAYIDASATASRSTDICATIFNILVANPNSVIDARGLSAANSIMTCGTSATSSTSTPWVQGASSTSNASTILLPAGTISIYQGWVLPNRTRIVGEGNNPTPGGTIIQACRSLAGCSGGSFTSNGTMIQMGNPSCSDGGTSGQCSGVSVENLLLEGNSQSVNGILNQNSGQSSYVDHVNLHFLEDTGLTVSGTLAQDSGPYANIACSTGNSYASGTACVKLDADSTRGVHGLTCTSASGMSLGPTAAVWLDSNYNTLEDIHIEGFQDGILIGSVSTATGDSIVSFNGAGASGDMVNVVHISSAKGVADLNVFGAAG